MDDWPTEQTLRHLGRYRISTIQMLECLELVPDPTTVRSFVRKLESSGLIAKRKLFGNKSYFQLSTRGARAIGEPEEAAREFGPQALPRAYGVASFCCLSGPERKRLTRKEFKRLFPDLVSQNVPFNDYIIDSDESNRTRLERLIVDLGGDAFRLGRKLTEISRELRDSPKALSMLSMDAFGFSVITTSEFKADAIRSALEKSPPGVYCRVVVVPDLINILPDFYG